MTRGGHYTIAPKLVIKAERDKSIYNRHTQGMTFDNLSKIYNISSATIRKIVKNFKPDKDYVDVIFAEDFPKKFTPVIHIIGIDNAVKLAKCMGKTIVYVPNLQRSTAMKRNQQIASEYNGFNFTELAEKYFLTTVRIRQIIKRYGNTPI